jgi:putative signal transducing protein
MRDVELVIVRTFLNAFDAELAKSALESAEIQSIVQADDAGGVQPGLWVGRGVELLVRTEDAARANEVLGKDSQD